MRVLVTGKNGQLGHCLQKIAAHRPDYHWSFVGRQQLDLQDVGAISSFLRQNPTDAIINCAAYTAVDSAESNPATADAVNHLAVAEMAEIAAEMGIFLIHVSTDYVFPGTQGKPYVESDETSPLNVYGASKLKGEEAIIRSNANAVILRTSWVFSEYCQNFVKTMLRLGNERDSLNIVCDQIGSPTYAQDLAQGIIAILDKQQEVPQQGGGIFHYTNEGITSWYDFAIAIFDLAKITCHVSPIPTSAFPTPARRPSYSVIGKDKIKSEYGIYPPYWRDALKRCIDNVSSKR